MKEKVTCIDESEDERESRNVSSIIPASTMSVPKSEMSDIEAINEILFLKK
jgi:hypothetical protein